MTPEKRKTKVMEFWNAVSHTGDVTSQNPFLHHILWDRKHTNRQVKGSDGNYEDPGGEGYDPDYEGYDPDGKDGVILMDLCEKDQNK